MKCIECMYCKVDKDGFPNCNYTGFYLLAPCELSDDEDDEAENLSRKIWENITRNI